MAFIENLVEYYDEIFPVNNDIKLFFDNIKTELTPPIKMLDIGCGTGVLEVELAKRGFDITGIETSKPLMQAAGLKTRNQLLPFRFFKLSVTEMTKFLGKNFYNIISCLNNRLVLLKTEDNIKTFFEDTKILLKDGGKLIVHTYNYDLLTKEKRFIMPIKKSIRINFHAEIYKNKDGVFLNQYIEKNNIKIPVMQDKPVFPLTSTLIEKFAKKAGFKNFEYYGGFNMTEAQSKDNEILCVIY